MTNFQIIDRIIKHSERKQCHDWIREIIRGYSEKHASIFNIHVMNGGTRSSSEAILGQLLLKHIVVSHQDLCVIDAIATYESKWRYKYHSLHDEFRKERVSYFVTSMQTDLEKMRAQIVEELLVCFAPPTHPQETQEQPHTCKYCESEP